MAKRKEKGARCYERNDENLKNYHATVLRIPVAYRRPIYCCPQRKAKKHGGGKDAPEIEKTKTLAGWLARRRKR